MKKKIFGTVLIAAMVLAAGWNFNQSKNEVNMSELALANVEALAYGEISGSQCFRTWYQEDIFGGSGATFLAKVCDSCIYKYLNSASNPGNC